MSEERAPYGPSRHATKDTSPITDPLDPRLPNGLSEERLMEIRAMAMDDPEDLSFPFDRSDKVMEAIKQAAREAYIAGLRDAGE